MVKHIMRQTIKDLAASLKKARQLKGYSQRDLAKMLGMPQSHLSNIENGKVNVTLSHLIDIARTIDLEIKLIPMQYLRIIENLLNAKAQGARQRPMYADDEEREEEEND